LENALRALGPVVAAAAKTQDSSQPDLDRAIKLVQRTAAAMESLQERLRQTEHYAMEFVHNARNDLAIADEKLAKAEATIEVLQGRVSELENALNASSLSLESEQENLRQAREWLIYLHDHIVEGLSPAAELLERLNANTGPLLPMLVAATLERASSRPTDQHDLKIVPEGARERQSGLPSARNQLRDQEHLRAAQPKWAGEDV
jgi:predicted  nucleic acid-binding Zn-ribbon protein